jgi:hypothetical protein
VGVLAVSSCDRESRRVLDVAVAPTDALATFGQNRP